MQQIAATSQQWHRRCKLSLSYFMNFYLWLRSNGHEYQDTEVKIGIVLQVGLIWTSNVYIHILIVPRIFFRCILNIDCFIMFYKFGLALLLAVSVSAQKSAYLLRYPFGCDGMPDVSPVRTSAQPPLCVCVCLCLFCLFWVVSSRLVLCLTLSNPFT